MTELSDPLLVQADLRPHAPVIIDEEGSVSYAELALQVERRAASLQQSLADTTPRVALLGENSRGYIITLLALWHIAKIACPLSTRLPHNALADTLFKLRTPILLSDRSGLPVPCHALATVPTQTDLPHGSTLAARLDPNRLALLLFTSGSTAEPKIAALSYRNLYFNALGSNQNIPVHEGDRWLLSLPLYHVGGIGIIMRTLLGGGAMIVPQPGHDLVDQALHYRATHLSLVSTQLQSLLDHENSCAELRRSLKIILLGGSAFPQALIDRALDCGLPLARSYGLTEAASQVTTTSPHDPPELMVSSGRTLPYRELMISADGEILVRGKTLFAGYWSEGNILDPRDNDGWFATGDLGEQDNDGTVTIHGRRDNLFISGGENIQPEEIEQALLQIAGVQEAVVVPIDDARFGQRPVAFVRMAPGQKLDSQELDRQLREILPRFKVPDHFWPWPHQAGEGLKPSRRRFKRLAAGNAY